MKARYYVLLLVLIIFRGIVIEAAKKSRPKGDVTKDQIQSPTPGSNNMREYTVEHTPELEEPYQKKNSPPREFQKEIYCDVSFK